MKQRGRLVVTLLIMSFFTACMHAGDIKPSVTGIAPVPKTGQIKTSEAGDDGQWQKGVASPDPRFIDNGDGTITDSLTKLIWLKDANCFVKANWSTALIDCNALADGSCGLTDGSLPGDWRLPNIKELQSLVDFGQHTPALTPGHPFAGVHSNWYWSGTTYDEYGGHAWGVYMQFGKVFNLLMWNDYFVWPVRDGNN